MNYGINLSFRKLKELNAKRVIAGIGLLSFVIGLFFMIVADGVDSLFLVGLGLFIIFIIIFMVSLFWKVAVSADDFTRRHF